MEPTVWAAFAAASIAILLIPGPTVLLVVSYALSQGRRAALAIVAGVALGDLVAMSVSLAGLGAVLAASATLFTVLKWIGAAYLVYLGVSLWRAAVAAPTEAVEVPEKPARAMAWHAFAVTALNPKSIAFFVAFVPQFIDATRPVLPQIVILEATFVGLAALNAYLFALAGGRLRRAITRPAVLRWVNRAGGTCLIGAGFATAATQRA